MDQKRANTYLYILLIISLIVIIILSLTLYLNINQDKKNHRQDIEIVDGDLNKEDKPEDLIDPDNKDNSSISVDDKYSNDVSKDSNQSSNEMSNDYTLKDNIVIEEFANLETSTINILNNENDESASKKMKAVFISMVDFLFYDGKIKGITFDELSNAGKEKVLSIASSIDTKIETKFPGYKENISSKASNAFIKASEIIKKGANNVKEFSREKLGEDNYNSIISAKDELVTYTKFAFSIVKDVGGSFLETTTDKIKNWYEKFKNNNN